MISESTTVLRILDEDDYKEVQESEALPGDVVVYVTADGDVEHSGIVVEAGTKERFMLPFVLSKWGFWKEYKHLASICPYSGERRYFRVVTP